MSVRTRFRNKYVTFSSFVCGLLLFTYFIILKNYTTSPSPTQAGQGFEGALAGFYQTTAAKNLNSGEDGGRAPQQVKAGNAWTGLLNSLRFLNKDSPSSNNPGNYELINEVYNPNAQSSNATMDTNGLARYNVLDTMDNLNNDKKLPFSKKKDIQLKLSTQTNTDRINWMNHVCDAMRASRKSSYDDIKNEAFTKKHYLIDHKHKLLYCYVPKVSSSAWKSVFLVSANHTYLERFEGFRDLKNNITGKYGYIIHSRNAINELNNTIIDSRNLTLNYTTFLFTRNPLDRVISAYFSKFYRVNGYFNSSYYIYIKNQGVANGTAISFIEFVAFIIRVAENKYPPNVKSFLLNEHWRPISSICEPCQYEIDFLGKHETLEDDANVLYDATGLRDINYFPFNPKRQEVSNLTNNVKSNQTGTKKINCSKSLLEALPIRDRNVCLLQELPQELMIKLLRVYKDDFILFYPTDPDYLKYRLLL